MTLCLPIDGSSLLFDISSPIDLSIPVLPYSDAAASPSCFYVPPAVAEPLVIGTWVGSVSRGNAVNCAVSMMHDDIVFID